MSRRRTPLAWHNLLDDRARSLVAIVGVSFALVVIFMQSGFLQSILRTATVVTDKLDFDAILVSHNYLYLAEPDAFPRPRLAQVAAVPGVRRVLPFSIGTSAWRSDRRAGPGRGAAAGPGAAEGTEPGRRRPILVLGFDLADRPFRSHGFFRARDVEEHIDELKAADAVLVDRRSRREFGPLDVGIRPEIGLRRYRVVGQFAMGTGFAADGAILVGDQTFRQICGAESEHQVNLGLIQLEPGAAADTVADAITRAVPSDDVRVMTRAEFRSREMRYWIVSRSIGAMFVIGVTVAFLVGVVVANQVLSSDIADHLAEYATLRAIGYSAGQLSAVVLQQGLIIAAAAYVPSLLLSWWMYILLADFAVVPIEMHPLIAVPVLAAAAAMCSASALAALRKVVAADPADMFG